MSEFYLKIPLKDLYGCGEKTLAFSAN
jgi:hypothetical protein